jgi:hypothetical protein
MAGPLVIGTRSAYPPTSSHTFHRWTHPHFRCVTEGVNVRGVLPLVLRDRCS